MMHFPPVSDFPLFSKKFSDSEENFHNFTFSRKISYFHPQKFLMTFFSHRPQISNLPLIFPVSLHFPPVSRKLLFSPCFDKFPPCFTQINLIFTYFTCIFSPYF